MMSSLKSDTIVSMGILNSGGVCIVDKERKFPRARDKVLGIGVAERDKISV